MIRPPLFCKCGRASLETRKGPRTLVANMASHCSSFRSSKLTVSYFPALLIRISSPPSSRIASVTAARTLLGSVTSQRTARVRIPVFSMALSRSWQGLYPFPDRAFPREREPRFGEADRGLYGKPAASLLDSGHAGTARSGRVLQKGMPPLRDLERKAGQAGAQGRISLARS